MTEPLMTARDLRVTFGRQGSRLVAVDGVSFDVMPGETVALVGESGSGKSTIALTLMRAHEPDDGIISFAGEDITHLPERRLRAFRRRVQMVFQDPYASLNPRFSIRRIIAEPLRAHRWGSRDAIDSRVDDLLQRVGLPAAMASRVPAQLSGGQRQRVSIARALALGPELLIADEPVSALDVSIQAQIINLLGEIQHDTGLSFLVIAHDLALVHQISDRVVVLYLGRVVEVGPTQDLVAEPQHPYTAALLSATPVPDGGHRSERIVLNGEPPSPIDRPPGCPFHPRCPIARDRCARDVPPLSEPLQRPGRRVACFYPGEIGPVVEFRQVEEVR